MKPSYAEILAARERISGEVLLTPAPRSVAFDDLVPGALHCKFENLQRTGSFKARGALNRLLQLDDAERERGVVTASAGNHAQAVSYHAGRLGIPAKVVMPETTPLIKVANTRRYGAEVILHGTRFSEAIEESHRLEEAEGRVMVHAYNDPWVVCGQGTIGLEIAEQVPEVDVVIVPIGGGGLISGIAMAIKELKPGVRVVGVEAEAAPSAFESRRAGEIVPIETAETIADGIAVKRVGEVTFPLIEEFVDDIVLVSDEEIATAIHLLLEREHVVTEGAGAAGFAALVYEKVRIDPAETVVPVLCGGNIDINIVSRIIDRGLVAEGRLVRLMVKVRDRPGSLQRLTELVAGHGANVLDIHHRRAFADISVGDVEIVMHLETRGRDHVKEIIAALEERGLTVEEDA